MSELPSSSKPLEAPPAEPPPRRVGERHLWEFTWVRDLLWLGGFVLLLALMYLARSILVPVCVALALAYVFNPLITWMQRRWGWPRWLGVTAVFVVVLLITANVALVTIPPLVGQTRQLIQSAPSYLRQGAERMNINYEQWQNRVEGLIHRIRKETDKQLEPPPPSATDGVVTEDEPELPTPPVQAQEQKPADVPWQQVGEVLLRGLGVGFDFVTGVLGFVTYLILFIFLTAICFFFFCWHFQGVIDWFRQFIPQSSYDRSVEIIGKMDRTLSAFIRGRLVQSLVLGAVLSIGWWIAGVPYWLLLGMGCGFLNLIPYAAFVGWPLAILLTWADQLGGQGTAFNVWGILVWPSVVYLIGQALDGWVVEPLVQGKATALDPLSVLLAVMIGAALAGVLGMLLAIPVAACAKILAQEVIIPRLRNRAQIVTPP